MPRVILPPSRVIFSRLFLLFVFFFFFLFEQPFGDVEKIEFPVSPSDGIDRFFFFFVVFFFRRGRGRGEKKVTPAAEKRSLSLLAKKPRLFWSSLLSCVLRQPSKNWKSFARRHCCAEETVCLFEANRNTTKRDEVQHPLKESLNSETSSTGFRNFLCIFLLFNDPMYLHPILVGHENTR